jgi:hypothetical protein
VAVKVSSVTAIPVIAGDVINVGSEINFEVGSEAEVARRLFAVATTVTIPRM